MLNTPQLAVAYILRSSVPKVTPVSRTLPLSEFEFIVHPPTTIVIRSGLTVTSLRMRACWLRENQQCLKACQYAPAPPDLRFEDAPKVLQE
jgi:hypothetical protein